MWVGIGVGIGRNRFATGIFNAYALRVTADGGITEAGQCVDAVTGLLLNASLLLIPSGYKGGRLYSQIPTNGNGDLTWTRASDAFRTNASGLIQRVPWNLASYSEQFDNASWLKSYATVTANSTTAPDGNTTADKIVGAGNNPLIYQSTSTLTGKYTFSIYGKKGELSWLRLTNSSAGTNAVWFDLNNGAVGTLVGAGNSANITSVGNGWYRCEFIINSFDSSQLTDLVIACTNADNTTTGYTGNSVDGLFIWGAQLVEGTTAQTYLPTTDRLNFPRLSYMYGSCPAVLLEPQRTNLALYSQQFDDAYWSKGATSISANNTTSPDGNTTADKLTADGTPNIHALYFSASLTNATSYTFSAYAKKDSNDFLQIYLGTTLFGTNAWANYNLNTGVVGSVGSAATALIQNVGNGWYRIIITATTISTGTTQAGTFCLISSATSGRAESNTLSTSVFLYGAQLEAGAYPTTYIPTTSATVTRLADSCSKTGISSLIGQTEGTVFVEFSTNNLETYTRRLFSLSDGTNPNQIDFQIQANTTTLTFAVINGGAAQAVINTSSNFYTLGSVVKIGCSYKENDFAFYANGNQIGVDTLGSVPTCSEFKFSSPLNVNNMIGNINQVAIFTTRLSNTQLAELTTL